MTILLYSPKLLCHLVHCRSLSDIGERRSPNSRRSTDSLSLTHHLARHSMSQQSTGSLPAKMRNTSSIHASIALVPAVVSWLAKLRFGRTDLGLARSSRNEADVRSELN